MVSVMDGKSNNIDRLLFGLSSYEVPLINNTTYLLKPVTPSAWSDSEIKTTAQQFSFLCGVCNQFHDLPIVT